MDRSRRAAALPRRQLLRGLGGLVEATLGTRAVSEHAEAKPQIKRPPKGARDSYPIPTPCYGCWTIWIADHGDGQG